MHVVTVGNRKGGVGKTSVAVHLAATLGRRGAKVVLIDLDSQANATAILTELKNPAVSAAEVLLGDATVLEALVDTRSEGVRLVPASKRLVAAQLMLSDKLGRESMLKRAMKGLEADVVLIDTGPDGHWAAANALVASTHVLIPFVADPLALQGLVAIEALVHEVVSQKLNPSLRIVGVLQVAADRRVGITEEVRAQAAKLVGRKLFETVIRENSRFSTCGAWHQDITQLEPPSGRGVVDYAAATDEMLARLEKRAA